MLIRFSTVSFSAILVVLIGTASDVVAQTNPFDNPFEEYDLMMLERPVVEYADATPVFEEGLKELWLKALERKDPELKRMVLDTFGIAHTRGLPGLDDVKPKIAEILKQPDITLDVLRAAAKTLVVLDASDQAASLAEFSKQHGLSVGQIVEPALAAWQSPVMKDTWLERISTGEAGETMTNYAIQGLASLKADEATEPLTKMVLNTGQSIALRMAAAKGLGQIHDSGLVELATQLVKDPAKASPLNASLANELLVRHSDSDAVELLTGLVGNPNPAVQARALGRLYEIDFELVNARATDLITSKDANVRAVAVRSMIDKEEVDRIQPISTLLDDVNPSLRREVAASLIKLAEIPALKDEVLQRTFEVLQQSSWRGCEQACVVLGKLDYEPSGPRMVELLGHERGEVQVASAWGLTQLRVEELLPDMLDHAQSVYDGFKSGELNDRMLGASEHVAHIFQAFGDQDFEAAEPLIRKYIPKDHEMGINARAAACWAIGMIREDQEPDQKLFDQLQARFMDYSAPLAETTETRMMCAVSLGRMNDESALQMFRDHLDDGPVGRRCYWAANQIGGDEIPPPKPTTFAVGGWFLGPLAEQED